ncbi:surface lipoprotein assembly modifier [Actinobacillus porcinus]|uniref:surface lipoprotein assembly modifier n=1 Tax=Actinobacillus porcinus TaxID=51048 RepID=UPI0023557201|nr:surface lipoprotein assembly modifier [Actinobacillus porcinus]MCI5764792.1 surface lipoprotein assembly modifier [Actinobacillus porcinus]MDY5422422.1 surface lipoprotein assembly modifier [Actinobacillus porcinus]
MKTHALFLTVCFPISAFAFPQITAQQVGDIRQTQIKTELEPQINVAKLEKREQNLPPLGSEQAEPIQITLEQLKQNPVLTHELLTRAIYARNPEMIKKLLEIYRTFPNRDPIMERFAEGKLAAITEDYTAAIEHYREILAKNPNLNPVRIELAIALFNQKQDGAAKDQFEKAQTAGDLPPQVKRLIDAYLEALKERDSWNVDFSFNYVRDTNVNNVGSERQVVLENGGVLTRSESMLPQTAHGLAYSLDISRDFNLWRSHYFTVGNEFWGKSYWDNHEFDDISNRTFVGYAHKIAKQNFRIKPFYEKRWYGGESYRWSNGARVEFSRWLSPNWQLSTAGEFSKQRYLDSTSQNGNNKLISATLLWARTPKQFFYLGSDFMAERTKVRQYGSDSKSLRLGWGQEWNWGISSRFGLSIMKREYKDIAKLGNINLFSFGKRREDKIYGVSLSLWKRDWHIWGITPKLQLSWRKQDSNISEMYSYTQKNVNILFEKTF